MKKWLGLVALVAVLTGCEHSFSALVDEELFGRWGRTLVAHPETVTLKEIHLGTGSYAGREVIIEGAVVQVSEHGTYAVLSDDEARMLVVLTDLTEASPGGMGAWPKTVRVLGTVESGKKGLPFLRARALSLKSTSPAVAADGKA